MQVQNTISMKGAGVTYKTYVNSQIRKGKFNLSYADYLKHFDDYWKNKVVASTKWKKQKNKKNKWVNNSEENY